MNEFLTSNEWQRHFLHAVAPGGLMNTIMVHYTADSLRKRHPREPLQAILELLDLAQTEDKNKAESLSQSRPVNPRFSNWNLLCS